MEHVKAKLYSTIKLTSFFLYQVNSIWSEGLCDELECRLTNDLQLEVIRTKITCPACRADEVAVEVWLYIHIYSADCHIGCYVT